MDMTRLLIEAAGIIVARPDMTVMYDERGARYELPEFVLSDPISDQQGQQQLQPRQRGAEQLQQQGGAAVAAGV